MKTTYILMASAALLSLAGCHEKEQGLLSNQETELWAVLEDSGTRVSIDADGKLTWNENDLIAVYVDGSGFVEAPILEGTSSATGLLSIAEADNTNRNHFAVYPSTAKDDAAYGDPTLRVTLPAAYDISDIISGTAVGRTESFSPMPMVALNSPLQSVLHFRHVGGLMRITCDQVPAGTKSIKVTTDKTITGSFVVKDPGSSMPTILTPGPSSDNSVVFTISSSGLSSSVDGIVLNVPVPCGTYNSVRVQTFATTDASGTSLTEAQSLERHTFVRHHGWKVPFEEMSFSFVCEGLSSVTTDYVGSVESIATSFVSYKTDGTQTLPVPFKFQYSLDGTTWTDGLPGWLTVEDGFDYGGSVSPEAFSVEIAPQVNSLDDPYHLELSNKSNKANDFDLATITFHNNHSTDRTTANCYVVEGNGTYRFPLVYGNGVKRGVIGSDEDRPYNTAAYSGFQDHLGNAISNPYLTAQLNKSAGSFTPVLIWTDVPGLVKPSSLSITGEGEDAYLHFLVDERYVTQGNALIGVLVDADGHGQKLAWSWHIWVTNTRLSNTHPAASKDVLPVYLGWCDARTAVYQPRECQIRAYQEASGQATEPVTISQTGATVSYGGNSPYYQWGRKDPLQASSGKDNSPKAYHVYTPAYAPAVAAGPVARMTGIQNPTVFYTSSSDWCSSNSFNAWNANASVAGQLNQSVEKTIYDPSPVGFKVSKVATFDGFSVENFHWIPASGTSDAGATYTPGVSFYPATGFRTKEAGAYTGVGTSGYLWTCVPQASGVSYHLFFNSSSVQTQAYSGNSTGFPIRPEMDEIAAH